jgi:predicted ATPase
MTHTLCEQKVLTRWITTLAVIEREKMLQRYMANSRSFAFVRPIGRKRSGQNTFTVIVGKNGTGKSRLLRSVVEHLIDGVIDRNALAREERLVLAKEPSSSLSIERAPSRIICVSTSPFDKFPLLRRDQLTDGYSYLGLRGLPSANLGLAYMSRIISTLIDAAARSSKQAHAVANVLEYLGYEGIVRARFQPPPSRLLEELLAAANPAGVLDDYMRRPMVFSIDGLASLRHLQATDSDKFLKVIEAARRIAPSVKQGRVEVSVSSNGVEFDAPRIGDHHDLLLLASSGLLRLRDVTLFKRGVDRPLKLHEASSGEQAVVMGLLGIGSHIQDDALICIDEPEVCLHPEWQEKYIELLFQTFSQYRGCHFVIATHSPQIVAQLPDGDCYVMAMEDGIARRARDYTNRSIDFQLAEVFNAPGFRNEYLSRVALNAFARVSKAKRFDEQSLQELSTLRKAFPDLRSSDPLRDLTMALEEMARTYG